MLRRRRAAKTAHAVPPHAQFEKDDAKRIKKSLRDLVHSEARGMYAVPAPATSMEIASLLCVPPEHVWDRAVTIFMAVNLYCSLLMTTAVALALNPLKLSKENNYWLAFAYNTLLARTPCPCFGSAPRHRRDAVPFAQAALAALSVMSTMITLFSILACSGSTPETIWDYYGISPEDAVKGGLNPQMFNSFLDGTKSAIEMAATANATGLLPPSDGLLFPPSGVDDLASVLRPVSDGGQLERRGSVEVVSSLRRDGTPVDRDLRWGVYATFAAGDEYVRRCFAEYGLQTDESGWYASQYKPFHLIGLELGISVASAALRAAAALPRRGWWRGRTSRRCAACAGTSRIRSAGSSGTRCARGVGLRRA